MQSLPKSSLIVLRTRKQDDDGWPMYPDCSTYHEQACYERVPLNQSGLPSPVWSFPRYGDAVLFMYSGPCCLIVDSAVRNLVHLACGIPAGCELVVDVLHGLLSVPWFVLAPGRTLMRWSSSWSGQDVGSDLRESFLQVCESFAPSWMVRNPKRRYPYERLESLRSSGKGWKKWCLPSLAFIRNRGKTRSNRLGRHLSESYVPSSFCGLTSGVHVVSCFLHLL